MEIVDISEEYLDTYCKCLEDWSGEMAEAGTPKREWYGRKRAQGLRVKLARNEKGEIVGMIHYAPVEVSPAIGEKLYYVYCVWVHGYKRGVGDNRKKGIGKALLAAAEEDAKSLGADGLAAWGITLPFFMRSRWFKKQGYESVDRDGMIELVWKPFNPSAKAPRLRKMAKKPSPGEGRTKVTCFRNGWCPGQNLACERMKRAAAEFGEKVEYVEVDTEDGANRDEWGICDAIFIDDKLIGTGPPPSYDKLRKILGTRVRAAERRS